MNSKKEALAALARWEQEQDLLERAARDNDPGLVRKLLAQGADPAQPSRLGGECALRQSLRRDALEAMMEMVKSMPFPCAEPDGSTPLMWAAHWGKSEAAQLLLDRCDPRAILPGIGSALCLASNKGPKLVEILLPASDVDQANAQGDTPLHLAAASGDAVVIKMLLDAGARCAVNARGLTPLMRAVIQSGRQEEPTKAIEALASQANTAGGKGKTPLMVAAESGAVGAIKALLSFGANPLAKTTLGKTALMFAAQMDSVQALSLLLPVSDPLAVGGRGADRGTALDFAKQRKLGRNVDLLIQAQQAARANIEARALSRASKPAPARPRARI